MRLSVVAEDLQPPLDEGAKKASYYLIRSLAEQGAEVSVFTRQASSALLSAEPLPANKLLAGSGFRRALRARRPEAILYIPVSSGTLGAFGRAASLKAQSGGTRLGMVSLQYRRLPPLAGRLGLRRLADPVYVQSQASQEALQAAGCRSIRLPAAVDGSLFKPVDTAEKRRLREAHGYGGSDRVVLHVGPLKPGRNVQVFARLAQAGYRAVLIASTSLKQDPALLQTLRATGVEVITSYIDGIQEYYQMADVYLFPVLAEKSAIDAPLSVLEALACNLPVVTTPYGALPGLLPPGDGVYFAGSDEDILRLIPLALDGGDCRTADRVTGLTWAGAARVILTSLEKDGAA